MESRLPMAQSRDATAEAPAPSSQREPCGKQSAQLGKRGGKGDRSTHSQERAANPLRGAPRFALGGIDRLLCIGACCKDIERGAGGTVAQIIAQSPHIEVWWVVMGCEDPNRARRARRAAKLFLKGASKSKVVVHGFREGYLQFQGEQVREMFEELAAKFRPDFILTHRDDGDLDHRLVSEMTWATWWNRTILEYEIFSGNTVLRPASLYVPLDEQACQAKIAKLREAYGEHEPGNAVAEDVLWSLMRLRGAESGTARFAEAFQLRRLVGG